jgi:hypothetical protein
VTLKKLRVARDRLPLIAQNAYEFKLLSLVWEMTLEDMKTVLENNYQ